MPAFLGVLRKAVLQNGHSVSAIPADENPAHYVDKAHLSHLRFAIVLSFTESETALWTQAGLSLKCLLLAGEATHRARVTLHVSEVCGASVNKMTSPLKFQVELQEVGRSFGTFTRHWSAKIVNGESLPEDLRFRRGYTKSEALSNLEYSIRTKLGFTPEFETKTLPRRKTRERLSTTAKTRET